MPSLIQLNRIEKFKKLSKTTSAIRVYTSTGKEFGIALNQVSPYTGEAGYSSRTRVLWPDGKTTLCTNKGMNSYKKKHLKIIG